MKYMTIRIKRETYEKLVMLKAQLIAERKRNVEFSEILSEIIDYYIQNKK